MKYISLIIGVFLSGISLGFYDSVISFNRFEKDGIEICFEIEEPAEVTNKGNDYIYAGYFFTERYEEIGYAKVSTEICDSDKVTCVEKNRKLCKEKEQNTITAILENSDSINTYKGLRIQKGPDLTIYLIFQFIYFLVVTIAIWIPYLLKKNKFVTFSYSYFLASFILLKIWEFNLFQKSNDIILDTLFIIVFSTFYYSLFLIISFLIFLVLKRIFKSKIN